MKTSAAFSAKKLAMIGVLAALTFAAHLIQIQIPTVMNVTRIHLGNALCLMSGMLLGPFAGGCAAGIGAMFYDFTDPRFISSAPFTLVFKFLMGFVCGLVMRGREGQPVRVGQRTLAAVCGSLTYVVFYLSKSFLEDVLFLRVEAATAAIDVGTKALASGFNAVLAVVIAVPLGIAVHEGLKRAGLTRGDALE